MIIQRGTAFLLALMLMLFQTSAFAFIEADSEAGTVASELAPGAQNGHDAQNVPGAQGAQDAPNAPNAPNAPESLTQAAADGEAAELLPAPAPPTGAAAQDLAVHPAAAEQVQLTIKVTGLAIQDGALVPELWLDAANTPVVAGSNALAASKALLEAHSFTVSLAYNNSLLDAITTPAGLTLASNNKGSAYSYWEFFVNGSPSSSGAQLTTPAEGAVWEWRYNDGAQLAFANQAVSLRLTGVEEIGGVKTFVPWITERPYYLPTPGANATLDALTPFLAVLNAEGMTYSTVDYGQYGLFLDTITKANGVTSLGSAQGGYWSFLINGAGAQEGASNYLPQPGNKLEFCYTLFGDDAPVELITYPNAPRPNLTSDAPDYVGGRYSTAPTPTAAATAQLAFAYDFLPKGKEWTYVSEPLVVGGNIILAFDRIVQILNGTTGALLAQATLATPIDYTCRPLYTQGIVVLPLAGGRLQAFTADTLTCVWVTDVLPTGVQGAHQNMSTLTQKDGRIFYSTAVADWSQTFAGSSLCVDAQTGAVLWQVDNATSGYYWGGGCVVGYHLYVADNSGMLYAFDAASGFAAGSLKLPAPVRSTVVSDGTYLYAVDTAGGLNRIALGEWGAPVSSERLSFAASSTSVPVIVGNKLLVGGACADYSGVLAVIDLEHWSLERLVTAPAEVKSAPLVVAQGSKTFVYFTYNAEPGGLLCYQLGNERAEQIYTPTGTDSNYCIASVVAAQNGFLYYTNDSGKLFALRLAQAQDPGAQQPDPSNDAPLYGTGAGGIRTVYQTTPASTAAAQSAPATEPAAHSTALGARAALSSSAPVATESTPAAQTPLVEELAQTSPLLYLAVGGIVVGVVGLGACLVYAVRPRVVVAHD